MLEQGSERPPRELHAQPTHSGDVLWWLKFCLQAAPRLALTCTTPMIHLVLLLNSFRGPNGAQRPHARRAGATGFVMSRAAPCRISICTKPVPQRRFFTRASCPRGRRGVAVAWGVLQAAPRPLSRRWHQDHDTVIFRAPTPWTLAAPRGQLGHILRLQPLRTVCKPRCDED